jgi:hypothetical protein
MTTTLVIEIDGRSKTFTSFEAARAFLKERHLAAARGPERDEQRADEHRRFNVKALREAGKDAAADALERGDLASFYAGGAEVRTLKPLPVTAKAAAKGRG